MQYRMEILSFVGRETKGIALLVTRKSRSICLLLPENARPAHKKSTREGGSAVRFLYGCFSVVGIPVPHESGALSF